MPVLATERRSATRSALRYRAIGTGQQATSAPVVSRARRSRADVRETTAPVIPDDLEQEEERQPRRRPVASAPPARPRRRFHPLFFLFLGLLLTILLWVGTTQVASWGSAEWNLLKYGNPSTYQIDAVVGQSDSAFHPSHFVAVNIRGIVTILDWPGNDPSHVRVLESTTVLGPNADQVVVKLSFIDVNHSGKLEMLIDMDGEQSELVNDGSTFRQPTSAEQQQLQRYLQQHS